ncbi:MAG: T9SS type A sorting domain-containing protein [Bacteroidaceae bacterium]|nr:T9SS type A sorting domain-containing protein [Bacteroidaceae bacterium]
MLSADSTDTGILFLGNDTTVNPNVTKGIEIDFVTNGSPHGVVSIVESKSQSHSSGVSCGVKGIAKGAGYQYGVFGGRKNTYGSGGAGIAGSSTTSHNRITGDYAGYFWGDVKATGTIYGTLVSPSSVSSPSGGGSTINLSTTTNRGETVTDKLQQVDLLQMERVNQNGSLAANKIETKISLSEDEELEEEDPIQTRLSDVSYGLAADQLKQVYPELVYEDSEGNYSINYIEMVPLLVQSIRELSAKVATLEQQLSSESQSDANVKGEVTAIEDAFSDIDMVTMSQNRPNPFSQSTVISLTVPETASRATINIYDMNGKQVQTVEVSDRGATNITVYAAGLTPGMYIYSLIVDGKIRATRKMIVQNI